MSVRRQKKSRNENNRKKEKKCKLSLFGETSDFNIYRGKLILNVLVLRFGTRNLFV